MGWTDERVELLKKLWAEGLSASQIAGRLGGVTRNAVIGKVHRLGLSGRATSSRSSSPRPRRTHVPRQHRAPSLMFGTRGNVALKPQLRGRRRACAGAARGAVIPPAERASILTLKEAMCRWPIGDPGEEEFHFCGRKKCGSLPYCEHHARMAYQPAQLRRRERARSPTAKPSAAGPRSSGGKEGARSAPPFGFGHKREPQTGSSSLSEKA